MAERSPRSSDTRHGPNREESDIEVAPAAQGDRRAVSASDSGAAGGE